MKKTDYFLPMMLMSALTVFLMMCGEDNTDEAHGSCTDCVEDSATADTGTGDSELPPIRYEDDQYADPDAGCDPQPEIALTAELTDEGDAWVDQCANRFGLQGVWFPYDDNEDGGLSEIIMDYSGAAEGRICASGTAGMVYYEDYAKYWGAGFGVNLCSTESDDGTVVDAPLGECTLYDPRTKIIGFRITIEGDQIPSGPDGADPQLRVQFAELERASSETVSSSESTYIIVDPAGGTVDYMFEDAAVYYAVNRGDEGVPPIDTNKVISLQFQVSTTPAEDTPFSFCVSDIMPILE